MAKNLKTKMAKKLSEHLACLIETQMILKQNLRTRMLKKIIFIKCISFEKTKLNQSFFSMSVWVKVSTMGFFADFCFEIECFLTI